MGHLPAWVPQQPFQPAPLLGCDPPPLTCGQALQVERRATIRQMDRHAHEAQGGKTNGCGHPPHLAIAPLPKADLKPGSRNLPPHPDRWLAFRQARILQSPGLGRQGATPLDLQALAQLPQSLLADKALHLHPVGAAMPPSGVGEAMLQPAVGGEQQQPFTVGVEAPGGVDAGVIDPVGQATPAAAGLPAELTENPVGLVEEEGVQGWRLDSGAAAATPEVDNADRDQQQTQVHRERWQHHRPLCRAAHPKAQGEQRRRRRRRTASGMVAAQAGPKTRETGTACPVLRQDRRRLGRGRLRWMVIH